MKGLHIPWESDAEYSWSLILKGLLFGIAVGVTEAVIIRIVMGAFGMFSIKAIYG